jgi:RNA polymerase-binding transcription factor DksA
VKVDDARRARLQQERSRTAARLAALARDLDEIVEASQLVSADDEHDPDGATVAFERAQVAALLQAAREELDELDHALERLENGSLGWCELCGGAIDPARLDALPATRRCVSCAR